MEFNLTSPAMIGLYVILGAFVLAFLYIAFMGNRLSGMNRQITPDSFKEHTMKEKKEDSKTPMFPQRVSISGYKIEPQPYSVDVSNELLKATVRKVCHIDDACCSQ